MSNELIAASAAINGALCQSVGVSPRALVIKLGIDVHTTSYVVVRQVDQAVAQPAQHFTPEQFLRFARRQVQAAAAVHSCYEAGPFGYVLHRQLAALGVHNVVVRPRDWGQP